MSNNEQFLTKAEYEKFDSDISQVEVDAYNNHPRGDCELSQAEREEIANQMKRDLELYERTIPKKGIESTLDNLDDIWSAYQDILKKNRESGITGNIHLILKGVRIEGVGQNHQYGGNLESDILAIEKKSSKKLFNFGCSFNSRGSRVFAITYDQNGVEHFCSIKKDIDFAAFNQGIDLSSLESADDLREKLVELKSQR